MLTTDTIKVAYASDLHLDFEPIKASFFKDVEANLLILAGDVAEFKAWKRHKEFFQKCSETFSAVLVVAGNHEFYGGEFPKDYRCMKEFLAEWSNIQLLQNETFQYRGVTFICSTLWTDCNRGDPHTRHVIEYRMNDFRCIRQSDNGYRKLSTTRTIAEHTKSKNFILQSLKDNDGPCVVVSHHAPTTLSVHPRYVGDVMMNGGYISDLSDIILDHPNLVAWIHGHVHNTPQSYTIGQCTVCSNTRGYPTEYLHEEYRPQVLELTDIYGKNSQLQSRLQIEVEDTTI